LLIRKNLLLKNLFLNISNRKPIWGKLSNEEEAEKAQKAEKKPKKNKSDENFGAINMRMGPASDPNHKWKRNLPLLEYQIS